MLSLDMPYTSLQHYLINRGWVNADERVEKIDKPGEGNMNLVMRVTTTKSSLILKQANPFVQKYPQIPAPVERAEVEATFYQVVSQYPGLQKYIPVLIGFDPEHRIIALQDLGKTKDCSFMYQKGQGLDSNSLAYLVHFLNTLHQLSLLPDTVPSFPNNLALRKLNHQHLFVFPYMQDNGFNLDQVQPGLQSLAMEYKQDQSLKSLAAELGEVYLSRGEVLIHGDFYPGSWLTDGEKTWVIDPEFCHLGKPEYDLGIFIAHLEMAQTPPSIIDMALQQYLRPANFDTNLAMRFAGMEIIRRIIGLAQLPFDLTLQEKKGLLDMGVERMKGK